MKTILFSLVILFILLSESAMAQRAVSCSPSTKTTTYIHYNNYNDILDINTVQQNYYSPDNCPPYQTGIISVNYGGWEDNYINYRNIIEYQMIMDDIDYINDPIPVLIINDNFEVK
jgi:hypothetical protein